MNYKAPDNTKPSGFALHDDMGGDALLSPFWPHNATVITGEEAQAIRIANTQPTPEQIAAQAKAAQDAADAQAAREDAAIAVIAAMTPAQAATYIENNVNNLADAKAVLKTMAKAICILARRI